MEEILATFMTMVINYGHEAVTDKNASHTGR